MNIRKKVHIGIAVTFGLMTFGVLRFPSSIKNGGLTSAAGSCVALLAYLAIAEWVRRSATKTVQTAVNDGAKFGGVIAIAAITNHWLEELANLQSPFPAILGVGMWSVMFLLFGGASSMTWQKTGSVALGVLASVWSAFVSTIGTIIFAFSAGLVLMPHLERFLAPAFAVSGMTDASAFVVRNLFDSEFEHLLIAPIAALIVGITSGMACAMLQTTDRLTARVLGVLNVLLFAAGIAGLQLASSMERSARPPVVMASLCALGATLASAFPIIAAIRRLDLIGR
jgi:hypothetical protein